jgi:hypothetical protein
MLGRSCGIGRVFTDLQVSLVVTQGIDDVERLALAAITCWR